MFPYVLWSISHHVIPISRVWTYEIPVRSYKIMEYGAYKLFQDISHPPCEGLTLYFLFATAIKAAALSLHNIIFIVPSPYSAITQPPRLVDHSAQSLRHSVNKISIVSALPVATCWSWCSDPTNGCCDEMEPSIIETHKEHYARHNKVNLNCLSPVLTCNKYYMPVRNIKYDEDIFVLEPALV